MTEIYYEYMISEGDSKHCEGRVRAERHLNGASETTHAPCAAPLSHQVEVVAYQSLFAESSHCNLDNGRYSQKSTTPKIGLLEVLVFDFVAPRIATLVVGSV